MSKNKKSKILFSGGGTGGSVAPLLAVAEELKDFGCHFDRREKSLELGVKTVKKGFLANARNDKSREACEFEFLWLGTKQGPEKQMVEKAGINFRAINHGKWRRYFSLKNLVDIFKIKLAFWQAFFIMLKWRPSLVMSAGSFVSVPVVWAAWLLGVPILIHQQDVRPGLANRLMAPFAKIVTVTFEKSLEDYGKKAVWTGNPVRKELRITSLRQGFGGQANYEFPPFAPPSGASEDKRINNFKINESLPVVLILGGGTGALAINKLVEEGLSELTKFFQVIHLTGKNKNFNVILEPKATRLARLDSARLAEATAKRVESQGATANQGDPIASLALRSRMTNYMQYEFLDAEQMAGALKLADVVVTRAGMGTLTELSYLSKPSIIIPLPDSHQEENAKMFKDAGLVLEQKNLTAGKFISEIKSLINNKEIQKKLGENMGRVMKARANEAMAKIILGLLK